ncbi:hypothetical protein EMCRGX_G031139 [Ephydatia muelleri]
MGGLYVIVSIHDPSAAVRYSSRPQTNMTIFRPSGQKQFNTAIFPPTTDPTLIEFENAITSNNLMYMMKVLAQDCGNQELWGRGLACGKAAMEGSLEPFSVGRRMVSSLCRAAGRLHSTWGVASERFHVVKGAGALAHA